MPKIFFIIPPEIHYVESNVSRKIEKGREFRQKLGILAVAGYLREHTGFEPIVVDTLADGTSLDELTKFVEAEKPDLVGFSVLTFNLLDCIEATNRILEVSPFTKICYGGFHPTIYPNETLRFPFVDFIVSGDGEITFTELVKALFSDGAQSSGDFGHIKSLGWTAADGKPILNSRRPITSRTEYDNFPMPAHDLLDIDKYSVVLADEARVASIQTSRGCPGKCTFCDIRMTQYRYRSADNVIKEIRFLENLGVKEFFVVDDTFTINKSRTLEFCERLIKEGLNIKYKISSRVDSVDPEMLDLLAKSGCYRIHFGVESGNQRILDLMEKEVTPDQITDTFRMTKDAGIEPYAYMMIGMPTETMEEIEESINFINHLDPYHVNYSICTPFPKTKLYEDLLLSRPDMEDYWLAFAKNPDNNFKMRTANEFFTTEELRQIQDKALRKFYSSPRRILREVARTKSVRQLIRKARVGKNILMPRNLADLVT